MSRKAKKRAMKDEPPYQEYCGRFICREGDHYRVKADPNDSYSLHHGSFDSVDEAKGFIDAMREANIKI